MSGRSKTDLQAIQTELKRNQTQEFQMTIWSRIIMMKIRPFRVKTVVLNLLKKNMSYHICVQLGTVEEVLFRIRYIHSYGFQRQTLSLVYD